jgi:integrase|tara:strand:- start:437 stop:1417 length:981 start_codon:yes stop_codon:yes gene_type:complete
MAYVRKHYGSWQSLIRIRNHPTLAKSFKSKTDAKRWANETELKIRREDAGVAKIKYPTFSEIGLRYIADVSSTKRGFINERNIIKSLMREAWSAYPINKITPDTIGKFRDKQLQTITGTSINRKLDVISTIFTTCKKEWGYPAPNPVLSIRRPKKSEPRNRRLKDSELNLLIKGNHTNEMMRTIMQIMLETGMRSGEVIRISHDHLKGSTLYIPITKTKPRTIPLTSKGLTLIKNAKLPFNTTVDAVGKKFAKLCKHYKIRDAVPHDLRHNALTDFMRVKKLDLASTMMIAGHSDPRMLMSTYSNLQVEHVADKLKLVRVDGKKLS